MLRDGDVLPAASTSTLGSANFEATIDAPWLAREPGPFRVVLGPQDDYFKVETLSAFFEGMFTLTPMADRMAYRLKGPEIAHAKGCDIVSDGAALGAIQIAGDKSARPHGRSCANRRLPEAWSCRLRGHWRPRADASGRDMPL